MKKEDITHLGQLLEVYEKKLESLKKFQETNNSIKFNETKKELNDLIKKISNI
jgi:ABC-type transporter Mla subunit MlaD